MNKETIIKWIEQYLDSKSCSTSFQTEELYYGYFSQNGQYLTTIHIGELADHILTQFTTSLNTK